MTLEWFGKQSCELIERIQDLEIELDLAKLALKGLNEEYREQIETKEVERIKAFAEAHNAKLKQQVIYCGTEEQAEFFKTIISTLGIEVDYKVQITDGEYEVVIYQ